MLTATKLRTTVKVGGRIDVSSPDLSVGETVEVIILSSNGQRRRRSAREILAAAPGHRLFKTAEEVDAYIREERESWER